MSEQPQQFDPERIIELRSRIVGSYSEKANSEGLLILAQQESNPTSFPGMLIALNTCKHSTLRPSQLDFRDYTLEEVNAALKNPITINLRRETKSLFGFRKTIETKTIQVKLNASESFDGIHTVGYDYNFYNSQES